MSDMLYPLKFEPVFKDKIWGGTRLKNILYKAKASDSCGESWEISGVQENLSIVKNGFLAGNNLQELIEIYMGELVGDSIFERFGVEFPLLIKFIDANDILSLQVHPDDELARIRHNAFGKTEMWYVIEAEEGSEIISGFNKETNKSEYLELFQKNDLSRILNHFKAKPGEVYFIPSGRVHATGSGILFAEIQQTSDITYRIHDWNRIDKDGKPRELHTDLAIDAIDFKQYDNYTIQFPKQPNEFNNIIDCPYFTTNYLPLQRAIHKDYFALDSFVIYMCLEGKAIMEYGANATETIQKGETILLPASIANINLKPLKETELLEIYIN